MITYRESVLIFRGENGFGTATNCAIKTFLREKRFVITAAHCIDGEAKNAHIYLGKSYKIEDMHGNISDVKLEFVDAEKDIAVLSNGPKHIPAVPFKIAEQVNVGETVSYTGHPNKIEYLSLSGTVAGVRGDAIVLNLTGWMGASGSLVFNSEGEIIGTVSAAPIGVFNGLPAIVPNLVILYPLKGVNLKKMYRILK